MCYQNLYNPAFCVQKHRVRLQRRLDYRVTLSMVSYGDCTSHYGQTTESVGLLRYWMIEVHYTWTLVIQKPGHLTAMHART